MNKTNTLETIREEFRKWFNSTFAIGKYDKFVSFGADGLRECLERYLIKVFERAYTQGRKEGIEEGTEDGMLEAFNIIGEAQEKLLTPSTEDRKKGK